MCGLFTFFYACLHFTTFIWFDHFFDLQAMWKDIVKRPFITVGFSAFVLLMVLWLPLVYCPLAHMVWGSNGYMNGLAHAGAGIHATTDLLTTKTQLLLYNKGTAGTNLAASATYFYYAGDGTYTAGWYRYGADALGGEPDPVVSELIAACAREAGVAQRVIPDDEILSRAAPCWVRPW